MVYAWKAYGSNPSRVRVPPPPPKNMFKPKINFTKRRILITIFGICLIVILCGTSFVIGEFDASVTPHFDYNGFVDINVKRQIYPYLLSYPGGAGDTKFSQISDFSNLDKNGSIQKENCKDVNLQLLISLINRKSINETNPPAWKYYSKCEEYIVSDNLIVIDFRPETFDQAI